MEIFINDKSLCIDTHKNLKQVLTDLNYTSEGVAVAVNHKVIRSEKWTQTTLKNQDKILIIKAAQGG